MTEHRIESLTWHPPVAYCRNPDCPDPITPTDEDRAASRSNHDILWTPREPGDPEALREAFARHRRERNAKPVAGGLGNDHLARGMGRTWSLRGNG